MSNIVYSFEDIPKSWQKKSVLLAKFMNCIVFLFNINANCFSEIIGISVQIRILFNGFLFFFEKGWHALFYAISIVMCVCVDT